MEGGLMTSRTDSSPNLNFEQQRKRAKDLRRAHAEGALEAAVRIVRFLPRARNLPVEKVLASPLTLAEAQLVVAREAGFPGWAKLKRHIEEASAHFDIAEAIIDAAFAGNDDEVRRLLERDPQATRRSIYAAASVADAAGIVRAIQSGQSMADKRGGRRDWTPLLYLCCSRYRRCDSELTAIRLEIVQQLISMGVDVNATGREPGYASEAVTQIFDDYEWRPISGAAGRLGSPELVRLLIGSGAAVLKTNAILNEAVRGGSVEVLRLLLELAPREWYQIIWALKASVVLNNKETARMISRHSGSPGQRVPAIHEGIRLQRDAELIEIALGDDTSELGGPVRQLAYGFAVRYGQTDTAEMLRRRGASDAALTAAERIIGACITGSQSAVPRLNTWSDEDLQMLPWAIRNGHYAAVPLLLQAGLDPNFPDLDGETPVHLAVRAQSVEMLEALFKAGAHVDIRNFDSQTPLEYALRIEDDHTREQVTRRLLEAGASSSRKDDLEIEHPDVLFERAADAVAFGDIDTLRKMLDQHPALVHARSPRPHRCTLLNYCGANGTEAPRQRTPENAPEIAQLLLERGADPNATCNLYGGGATTMGLMITSAHPPEAKKDGELVRVLMRFGTRYDQGAFMCAIEYGLSRSVAEFLNARAPIDNLFIAAGIGRLDLVKEFLSKGVDIDTRFRGYGTALHAAAGMNKKAVVEYLLERGANTTLHNTWGAMPEDSADFFGHRELSEFIHNYRLRRPV
jgi:ankyrin repeat protein